MPSAYTKATPNHTHSAREAQRNDREATKHIIYISIESHAEPCRRRLLYNLRRYAPEARLHDWICIYMERVSVQRTFRWLSPNQICNSLGRCKVNEGDQIQTHKQTRHIYVIWGWLTNRSPESYIAQIEKHATDTSAYFNVSFSVIDGSVMPPNNAQQWWYAGFKYKCLLGRGPSLSNLALYL